MGEDGRVFFKVTWACPHLPVVWEGTGDVIELHAPLMTIINSPSIIIAAL